MIEDERYTGLGSIVELFRTLVDGTIRSLQLPPRNRPMSPHRNSSQDTKIAYLKFMGEYNYVSAK